MARPLRVEFPGALYLVTARAIPRQRLYRSAEEAEDFVRRLPLLAEGLGALFHAYCLLPNHYHLLIETPRGNLSKVLHRLNAGFTATINARRKRRGPLLQSRYRAILLDEYPWLLRCSVHLHLNPVRKKLAADAWSYPWSSAARFLPGAEGFPWLETHRTRALAGGVEGYLDAVNRPTAEGRTELWGSVWRGCVLGGEQLRGRVLSVLEGKDPREIAGFSAAPAPAADLETVVQLVAETTGMEPQDVYRGKYQRVLARKIAMDLAHRYTGQTLREIGEAFGVDYTTVHMAGARLRELRANDPGLDEFVAALEADLLAGSTVPGGAPPVSEESPAANQAPAATAEPAPATGSQKPGPARKRKPDTEGGSGQLNLF